MSQGDDKELVQPSVRQHLQNLSQPHVLLQASVSFLRHLHGLPRLSSKLRPLVHFLPPPHPSAARGSSVDGSALHRLHEDPFPGGDVSHTMRSALSSVTDEGFKPAEHFIQEMPHFSLEGNAQRPPQGKGLCSPQ